MAILLAAAFYWPLPPPYPLLFYAVWRGPVLEDRVEWRL